MLAPSQCQAWEMKLHACARAHGYASTVTMSGLGNEVTCMCKGSWICQTIQLSHYVWNVQNVVCVRHNLAMYPATRYQARLNLAMYPARCTRYQARLNLAMYPARCTRYQARLNLAMYPARCTRYQARLNLAMYPARCTRYQATG